MADDLYLRDVVERDLPIFFDQQLDPESILMAAVAARSHDAFMRHWKTILADTSVRKMTIVYGANVVGNIVCFGTPQEPLIGYWIGREYWGRGIATRALSAFLGLVKTRPLFARVAEHNVASFRVLQKCGFEVLGEGRFYSEPHAEEIEEFVLELAT